MPPPFLVAKKTEEDKEVFGFHLKVVKGYLISNVFSHSQVTDKTQLQELDILVPLADINSYLKLTEAAGQIW